MKRICVVNVAGLSERLLRRDTSLWLGGLASRPRAMTATFPALPASVQASMTTGAAPGVHGVIAGGVFRRQCRAVSLDERSNTLLNKKRFWHARALRSRPRVALVFWSNPLAGAADVVLGAAGYGGGCCSPVDLPLGLYHRLAEELGRWDPSTIHGPGANWRASVWIAAAGEKIWQDQNPDLMFVYLPGVDFELTRNGVDSAEALAALREVDSMAGRLSEQVQSSGGETIVVSDGGYVNVSRCARPNWHLRQAGLLELTPTDAGEVPDLARSRAFAMVDHQVAHLYCRDESVAAAAGEAVLADPAIQAVLHRDELFCPGLGHDRAGERVAMAAADAWFSYCWWPESAAPPPLAGRLDAPGKCGYDPCELFAGEQARAIAPDPSRVRASRGLTDCPAQDQCVLAGTCPLPEAPGKCVTDLPEIIRRLAGMKLN